VALLPLDPIFLCRQPNTPQKKMRLGVPNGANGKTQKSKCGFFEIPGGSDLRRWESKVGFLRDAVVHWIGVREFF